MTPKNTRFIARFVAIMVVAMVMAAPVWAKSEVKKDAPAAAATAQDPWQVRCDDLMDEAKVVVGKYCEMVQSIYVTQKDAEPSTAQRLMEFVIGYPPADKGKISAIVILPLGILLDQKNSIEVDGAKLTDFGIRYCDNGGCVGVVDLNDKDIAKMSKGKEMLIKGKAATGQDLHITLSLQGFGDVHQKILPKKDMKK